MATTDNADAVSQIRLPAGWTFAALIAGLGLGWALSGGPAESAAAAVAGPLGSLDNLKAKLVERGVGHFSNGWVWLADNGGSLSLEETHDGDTLADGGKNPLLTIDLWEHAYYLDYQNVRPDYLKAVLDNHLNWDFAAENLERGSAWTYPG